MKFKLYYQDVLVSFAALYLCLQSVGVQAEIVTLHADTSTVVTAQYRTGNKQAPAVLLLHGFLQTRNFSTVSRLADALVDAKYTVLAPTLSLGISHRARSLPCDAIQTHSMEQGLQELDQWVQWLVGKGHQSIVLMGHSAGSMLHVAYLSAHPPEQIKQAILISLSYFGQGRATSEIDSQVQKARAASKEKEGAQELGEYSLAYCKKYVTRPIDFLSYTHWSKQSTLLALQAATVPVSVVVGSADERMDKDWILALKDSKVYLEVVQGAGHFFDQVFEFDLLDAVETILAEGSVR